ncbi:MAG: recombinase RecT [Sphingomonadales bacterium]|nr:recombinase RecT [Sphingomonadaceae bacterium]MBS3930466.1 recombinase RecT [Sphingomonadales bacterium]
MTTDAPKKDLTTKRKTLPELLNDENNKQRFAEMLGKDARSFQQNILTVYNGSKSLQECEPESIIAACAISASINLSILPSLGQSCVVPYKDGDRLVAQWQIMWKGLIQLAHRSGQYERIHLAHVYEGELVSYDKFKGIIQLDESKKKSGRVQGYYFYFKLLTGGSFEFYWSAKECVEHGLRYSKSFQKGSGKWAEDPEFEKVKTVKAWLAGKEHFLTEGSGADAMSAKSIVKNELQTWGPLETRIKEMVANDQAVIGADGTKRYIDTTAEPAGEPKTYATAPTPSGDQPFPAEKIKWARDAAKKQGVSNEQFDAWLALQVGDEAVKAAAAEIAWKKVAAKEAKAVDVFAVKAPEAAPTEQQAAFLVTGTATADFNGNPDCYAIKDDSDPVVKYYTDQEAVYLAAKTAQKDEAKLVVKFVDKPTGNKTARWIVGLVA